MREESSLNFDETKQLLNVWLGVLLSGERESRDKAEKEVACSCIDQPEVTTINTLNSFLTKNTTLFGIFIGIFAFFVPVPVGGGKGSLD